MTRFRDSCYHHEASGTGSWSAQWEIAIGPTRSGSQEASSFSQAAHQASMRTRGAGTVTCHARRLRLRECGAWRAARRKQNSRRSFMAQSPRITAPAAPSGAGRTFLVEESADPAGTTAGERVVDRRHPMQADGGAATRVYVHNLVCGGHGYRTTHRAGSARIFAAAQQSVNRLWSKANPTVRVSPSTSSGQAT